jgi:Fasciclin domain
LLYQTSTLQRVGLTDELDIRYVRGEGEEHGHLEGSTAVTVFAPTNKAFERLPIKLKLFLFSPFGRRVLKKLLEYHIVPNVVAHAGKFLPTIVGRIFSREQMSYSIRPRAHPSQ